MTRWIRAAGPSAEFRPCYTTVAAAGRRTDSIAARLAHEVLKPPLAGTSRLAFALDDAPTPRYGRSVQGAGVHHNPTPGPAGGPFVYGRVWAVLGLLVAHPPWGVIASPVSARPYVREKDLGAIDKEHRPAFATKLGPAVELVRWAGGWLEFLGKPAWVVAEPGVPLALGGLYPLQVYVSITLARHELRASRAFEQAVRAMPEVIAADWVAGPGDVVFIPSGIRHAEITYLTPSMTYLTIRTVEPGDEPCCCGGDRQPS